MAKAIVKKTQTTALANWEQDLAAEAVDVSAKEITPSGQFISLKSGIISVAGSPVEGNKIQVIVLASVHENVMYEGEYDSDNPTSPVCYAFGDEAESLAPHEKASDKKCESCAGCEFNVFGTGNKGKGKACKNLRRLAVISFNGLTPETMSEAEIFFMKISVTNVKGWAHYVKGLAAVQKRPFYSVVTQISATPDPKTQFRISFTPQEALGGEWATALRAKVAAAKEAIVFPYADPAPATAAPAPKGKAKRKF